MQIKMFNSINLYTLKDSFAFLLEIELLLKQLSQPLSCLSILQFVGGGRCSSGPGWIKLIVRWSMQFI